MGVRVQEVSVLTTLNPVSLLQSLISKFDRFNGQVTSVKISQKRLPYGTLHTDNLSYPFIPPKILQKG